MKTTNTTPNYINTNKAYKMKTVILLITTFACIVFSTRVKAQQDPMYTQYNFNMQTINAAYAGTWQNLGIVALGRYQWINIDGAPTTYTLSVQAPTRAENMSWGANIIADKIGKEKTITLAGDYSYRLKLNNTTDLRLGLKVGITNYSNPLTDYQQYPGQEDYYNKDIDVKYMPNFGVGAFLSSEHYYIGFSMPRIVQHELELSDGSYSSFSQMRHFFLAAGYVFDLGENVKFKPTGLLKAVKGAPLQFDATANFLLKNMIWLGASYRWGDSFGFIGQFLFNEHTRIGYAIDFTTTKLRKTHNGTHEIMISYEFGSRKKWNSPRMF